jgi:predicted glycosyltransferase
MFFQLMVEPSTRFDLSVRLAKTTKEREKIIIEAIKGIKPGPGF